MVGAPLADKLMKYFAGPESVGVWQTFLVLAAISFVFMMVGGFAYRVPPDGWAPQGWRGGALPATSAAGDAHSMQPSMTVAEACRTRQFWLLWLLLCLNVSAGIGVIGMASPMLQEVFGGRLLGGDTPFERLDAADLGHFVALNSAQELDTFLDQIHEQVAAQVATEQVRG